MEELKNIYDAILQGRLEKAIDNTKKALEAGANPQEIIDNYMIKAMEDLGRNFEEGKCFVPNLLLSARAMKGALDLLKLSMNNEKTASKGVVVIGTVQGDLHDIGKNLVASLFEGCGFEVINLGVDVTSEKFINAAIEHNADIICMSALLTTTMTNMKGIIDDIRESSIGDKVKIMVGGAPLTDSYAHQIGADAYTGNANAAVIMANQLLGNA